GTTRNSRHARPVWNRSSLPFHVLTPQTKRGRNMDLTPPSATAGADRLPSPGGPSHRTSIKRTASAELHGSSRRPEIAASDAPSSSNRAVVIERAGSQSHEGAITLELSTADWMTEDPGPRLSLRKGLLTSSHDEAQHRMLTHVWAQLISGQVRFLIETETAEADGSAIIEL